MRPIITRSEITGIVYITTKYKAIGSGELDTYEKYDVTHEFDAIAGGIVAENVKLRDLVREMLICRSYLVSDAFDWYGCDGCPLHAGECDFEVRAKDFGIGVS